VKIAQVAPLYESVPPRLYGGTERIVAHLTDALVELGHDVTLFASADARTSAKLVSVRDQAMRLDPHPLKSDLAAHLSMLHELRLREDDFDVIHFHVDLIHFPFFEELAHKTPRRQLKKLITKGHSAKAPDALCAFGRIKQITGMN
jgi:glycosyltransferase involved in cell wall biosynthesis